MRMPACLLATVFVTVLIANTGHAQGVDEAQGDEQIEPYHKHVDTRHGHDHAYPDRGAVLRDAPRGSTVVNYAGVSYRFHDGVWFEPRGPAYIVVAPPIGLVVPTIPAFATPVAGGGEKYLYANDIYYRARPDLGGFEVVNEPSEVTAPVTAPTSVRGTAVVTSAGSNPAANAPPGAGLAAPAAGVAAGAFVASNAAATATNGAAAAASAPAATSPVAGANVATSVPPAAGANVAPGPSPAVAAALSGASAAAAGASLAGSNVASAAVPAVTKTATGVVPAASNVASAAAPAAPNMSAAVVPATSNSATGLAAAGSNGATTIPPAVGAAAAVPVASIALSAPPSVASAALPAQTATQPSTPTTAADTVTSSTAPPAPTTATSVAAGSAAASTSGAAARGIRVPLSARNGQSPDDQARDRYECYRFAVAQSGFDPMRTTGIRSPLNPELQSDYERAQAACLEGRGYAIR